MTGATTLTFLSPLGGLLVLAAVLPLAGLALAGRRVAAARALLGLERPPGGAPRSTIAALVAVPVLLGIAAAQPAIRAPQTASVRTDAQAMFLIDTSRSMLAAPSAGEPNRLARAQRAAVRMRSALGEISAGVGTLTDRALPNLLPLADAAAFDATVERAIGIERPPPQEVNVNATTLAPLSELATQGYFSPSARRRLLVVMTDGESRSYDVGEVGRALRAGPGVSLILVHFWSPGERVYRSSGRPEAAYLPHDESRRELDRLAAAADGASFDEDELGAAEARARNELGRGPTASQGIKPRTIPLAPYVAAAALLPLALLFRRRGAQ
ncbi:MAG TPA: hypothetical protein VE444_06705 [Gaiellaceae bacterium]|nr:hypothetical protein [Gaiellaceae bacterium]